MAAIPDALGLRRRITNSGHEHLEPPQGPAHESPGNAEGSPRRSQTAELWLQSRLVCANPPVHLPAGDDRAFTFANVRIAAQLVCLSVPRLLNIILGGKELRMAVYVLGIISHGILPTVKIWSTSRLLDLVQASFVSGGMVDRGEVIRVAALATLMAVGDDVLRFLLRDNSTVVQLHLDTVLQRAYLATQLSLSIPSLSGPFISALTGEASIFVGWETRTVQNSDGTSSQRGFSGPSDALDFVSHLLINLVLMVSQVYLVHRTLTSKAALGAGWSSYLLIFLAITPALLHTVGRLARPDDKSQWRRYYRQARDAEKDVRKLGSSGGYKQEVVLFGLKDWILARWDRARSAIEEGKITSDRQSKGYDITLSVIEEGIQMGFYVLLALRIVPTTLSVGSIGLYRQTAEALLNTIRRLSDTSKQVYRLIFLIAAYVEAIDLPLQGHIIHSSQPHSSEFIDYETQRVHGGMGLIARDLTFRYPKADKDVIHDINLIIPPGTTLAIVGVNGGGKTTLVKALMGLYNHQGSVLLNDLPIASYDPTTLHRRMSCLFQDFCKYSFTLRENVGIGNVDKMEDDEELKEAIELGDAAGGDDIQFKPANKPQVAPKGSWEKLAARLGGVFARTKTPGGTSKPPFIITPLSPIPESEPMSAIPLANRDDPNPEDVPLSAIPAEAPQAQGQLASLSGGQWRRLGLARASMRASEADLIVFDEPSASLDPQAEAQLFDRIHALSHQNGRRCTTIFISHRFSTVKRADQIAVVEDGTILECGSHTELMAKEGRYAELYNLQKAGFED